jgi:DHA2 family multidrug resistance protein-like MFS transporter
MQATARLSGQTAGAVASSLVFHLVAGAHAPQIGLLVATGMAALGALFSVMRVAQGGMVGAGGAA